MVVFICFAIVQMVGTTFAAEELGEQPVVLETLRSGLHEQHTSVVLEFNQDFDFNRPQRIDDEIRFTLNNVYTELGPYREYPLSRSWVRLKPVAEDIEVGVGLLRSFESYQVYSLETPDRLVVNLFRPRPVQGPSQTNSHNVTELILDQEASESPVTVSQVAPANAESRDATAPPSQEPIQQPVKVAAASTSEKLEAEPPIKKETLMTLNFYQSDIQEVLSALAIQQNINIVTEQDIAGDITVHLYEVPFDTALGAICQSGGFRYYKQNNVYYVYKPKVIEEPTTEKLEMRIFKLEYAEIDKIQQVLDALPNIRLIKIHEPTKTIIVEDSLKNIEKIEKLIRYWDAKPKQVLIEAKILEVTLTDDMSFGVNWEQMLGGDITIGTGGFSSGNFPSGPGSSPVPADGTGVFANVITGAGTDWQFTAALDALEAQTDINTLSTPKILAIHSKSAKVQVGGQQGYTVTTVSDGIATTSVEFIDTGTILKITPYIDADNNVLLKVEPTINSAIIEEGIPVVNSTVVTTWLMAKNGETVFIGGLIQNTQNSTRTGIPCLGDIPLLGMLFGRTTESTGKSELIVLITPRVISDGDSQTLEAIEKAKAAEEKFQ
jgi:type IV pilus secretin PilQ/predicted competence protein